VDWFQARDYAAWVGGALPSEAQWEYAARGPQGLQYPWGEEFAAVRSDDHLSASVKVDDFCSAAINVMKIKNITPS